jgi:signal transduction histidine kinase
MTDQHPAPHTHLEIELGRRTQRLSALYTVLSAYHQVNDLEEMMRLALNQVLKLSVGSVGSIHLLDEKGDCLCLSAQQGIRKPVLGLIQDAETLDGFFSELHHQKQAVIFTDMSAEPNLTAIAQAGGWQVIVGVPIISGKKNWGVLTIYGDTSLQTTPDEIQLLETIAGQIGIAIESSILREQAERLAITEERNRLARELHDSVTQSLYSLTLFSETARRMLSSGNLLETQRYLDEISESSLQALKEMRLLVHKLRPSVIGAGGLFASIEQRLKAVEGRSGVKYTFHMEPGLLTDTTVESTLYMVAVEALNNALKYAQANQVWVSLARDENGIRLKIGDDGRGFNLEEARQSGGLGLESIHERVTQLKGRVKIDTVPGEGTTLWVWIPKPDHS